RRATARAQRRLDPLQLLAAAGTELSPAAAADDTALRQKQVEHGSTLFRQVRRNRAGSVEAVLLAPGQPRQPPQAVVRLEELLAVPDVEPVALEAIAVDPFVARQPAEEAPSVVGALARVEIAGHEPDVFRGQEVDERRGE